MMNEEGMNWRRVVGRKQGGEVRAWGAGHTARCRLRQAAFISVGWRHTERDRVGGGSQGYRAGALGRGAGIKSERVSGSGALPGVGLV